MLVVVPQATLRLTGYSPAVDAGVYIKVTTATSWIVDGYQETSYLVNYIRGPPVVH